MNGRQSQQEGAGSDSGEFSLVFKGGQIILFLFLGKVVAVEKGIRR